MLLALPHFVVLCVILPLLGWISYRRGQGAAGEDVPVLSVAAMAIQIALLQTVVGLLGLLALGGTGLTVRWLSSVTPVTSVACLMILAAFVTIAVMEARRPLGPRERWRAALRKTSAGNPTWIGITLYAGVVEEFAYRGVLVIVLAGITGYWPAVLVSAIAFGLGHVSGGWRAAAVGVPFALSMQLIVHLSGGLFLAMLVHAVYDLIVAWLGHRIARRGTSADVD